MYSNTRFLFNPHPRCSQQQGWSPRGPAGASGGGLQSQQDPVQGQGVQAVCWEAPGRLWWRGWSQETVFTLIGTGVVWWICFRCIKLYCKINVHNWIWFVFIVLMLWLRQVDSSKYLPVLSSLIEQTAISINLSSMC